MDVMEGMVGIIGTEGTDTKEDRTSVIYKHTIHK
jgi:hypothetical protein